VKLAPRSASYRDRKASSAHNLEAANAHWRSVWPADATFDCHWLEDDRRRYL